jgi:hypothetical protein
MVVVAWGRGRVLMWSTMRGVDRSSSWRLPLLFEDGGGVLFGLSCGLVRFLRGLLFV